MYIGSLVLASIPVRRCLGPCFAFMFTSFCGDHNNPSVLRFEFTAASDVGTCWLCSSE